MNEMERTFMDALLFAMEGEDPSKAIELQEKRGQNKVVNYRLLPRLTNYIDHSIRWKGIDKDLSWEETDKLQKKNIEEWTKSQYEKMGIKIISEHDDLFFDVELPEGWKIEATSHHMWNNLLDDKGRKRANFFYKAAFYDRDAFINFDTRYHISANHVANASEDYEIWTMSDFQGTVKDGDKVIYSTECIPATGKYKKDDQTKSFLLNKLKEYMKENYPLYEDINAYW